MRSVFFISDRTGITTEGLGNALLTQFGDVALRKELIPFVDTELKADQAIIKINNRYQREQVRPIVITSIIDPKLRHKFDLDYVFHMDFFEAFIPALEAEIGQPASQVVGQSHGISDESKYYKRIDAIDFSLVNDDGVTDKNFDEADVILVGVSRVGKTPTCLYLAISYGIKAANYPLAETDLIHDHLPKILVPYHNKLFGLTIELDRLHHIRSSRIPNSHYADFNNCRFEIEAAERIMQHYDIPYLNSSRKSIEEISAAIMQSINLHRKF